MPEQLNQQDLFDLIQIREALKKGGDSRASKVDALIRSGISASTPQPQPEQPGFLRRGAQAMGIPTSGKELMGAAKTTALGIAHPMAPAVQSSYEYLKTAGQSLSKAREAPEEALGAVPLFGPGILQAGKDFAAGNAAGGLGGVAGTALGIAGLRSGSKAGKRLSVNPEQLAKSGAGTFFSGLDVAAGKRGAKSLQMRVDVEAAKGHLADISREMIKEGKLDSHKGMLGKSAEVIHDLAERVNDRQREIWEKASTPGIKRNANLIVDTGTLADTVWKKVIGDVEGPSLSPEPMRIRAAKPAEVKSATEYINNTLSKPMNLLDLFKLVREINADLKGKDVAQAYAPLELAARHEAVKAARLTIDQMLEGAGEQGVVKFNRQYGAMGNIYGRLQELAVQAARQEAKGGPMPEWANIYSFINPGAGSFSAISGISIHAAGLLRKTPFGNLRSGLVDLAKSGAKPDPFPKKVVAPSAPTIKGLLTSGSIITPPPADASFVRAVTAQKPDIVGAGIPIGEAPNVSTLRGSFERRQPYIPYPPDLQAQMIKHALRAIREGQGNLGKLPPKKNFKSK